MYRRMATMSAAAVLIFSLSSPVLAESVQDLKDNQKQIQKDRATVTANLSNSEKEIASILDELDKLQAKLDQTAKALKLNEEQLTLTKNRISNSETKVDKLDSEIDELDQLITKRYSLLKERLSAYQKSGGDIGYLEVLAGAQSFSQFASRAKAVSIISNSDYDLMKELEKTQDEMSEKQKTVKQELASQKAEQAELEGVRRTVADQEKQLANNRKKLKKKRIELKEKQSALKIKDEELASLQIQVGDRLKQKEIEEKQKAKEEAERKAAAEAKRLEEKRIAALAEKRERQNSAEQSVQKTSPADSVTNIDEKNESNTSSSAENSQHEKYSPTEDVEIPQSGNLEKAIKAGYTQIGTPYVWGGKKPGGFDCSGFVAWAYRQAGYNLPSSTSGLQYVGKKIPYSSAKPGDMVFFNTYKTNGHVGIYLGDGRFLGAQDSGLDVADMNSGYWKDHFTGHVRRIN